MQGLLAALLIQESDYQTWLATWPSSEQMQENMLLLWPALLRESADDVSGRHRKAVEMLPDALWMENICRSSKKTNLLQRQEIRLHNDWEGVQAVIGHTEYKRFASRWLAINSRCFYFETTSPSPRHDRIALCPYLDLLNHQDQGVCTQGQNNLISSVESSLMLAVFA